MLHSSFSFGDIRLINSKPIRHIATTFDGKLFATAEFERNVSIWKVDNGELQISFQTHLDFGGRRLAISPDGQLCAVGGYHIHGVSVYRTLDGSLVWNRKDLKKIQWLEFDPTQNTLLAGFDEKPLHILDNKTGETIETCRGVRHKYISPYNNNVYLLDATKLMLYNSSKKPISIERHTFAILDVTFSPQAIYLTESGGPLRAVNYLEGSLLWEYIPEHGSHFLTLGYNESTETLFGVMWSYEKDEPYVLVEFNTKTGELLSRRVLEGNISEVEFTSRGNRLITSNGIYMTKPAG